MKNTQIVICGAGIAGIATAYYLAVKYRQEQIVLIDKNLPMSLTTSKSGENFREYWPQPCMTALTRRSIDLMKVLSDDSNNVFEMRYSGYDFVSESVGRDIFPAEHLDHTDTLSQISGGKFVCALHDYLGESIQQLVHIDRAGAIDVHALGSLMLAKAKKAGVLVIRSTIEAMEYLETGYRLKLSGNANHRSIKTEKLVLTPGPFINEMAGMLGIELPIESVLQRKFVIPDTQNVIPRNMPFTIFADSQYLQWSDEERALIEDDPEYRWLLDEFPPGLHIKPEGVGNIKLGWAYNRKPEAPRWETSDDFDFPNITLRGASRFIPALKPYVDEPPTPIVQFSGYYTRTAENLPLIGPLDKEGLFTVSALSGYGTMAACSAGELCADWMMGGELPGYAHYFHPDRYGDDQLMAEIHRIGSDGQL
ncbi:MAG: FAD-binding oxidoreductase [Gammaproteobacteria bacterium]|nr:FAD-binding oxidoreductase [Gammaproteobacteria bacterium]